MTIRTILDLPATDYHQLPEWSRSQVMDYISSPELFCGRYVECNIPLREATAAMSFGTLVDEYLTENESPTIGIPVGVVVAPPDVLTSNGQKRGKKWDGFLAEHPGEVVWTEREADKHLADQQANLDILLAIDEQINQHEMARRYLRDDTVIWQPSYVSSDGWRARPDLVVPDVAVVDIKCMGRIDRRSVTKSCLDFGYDIQGALCIRGESGGGPLPLPFILICIHSVPPYEIETYELDDGFLAHGWTRFAEALEAIKAKQWRSVTHGRVRSIRKPAWLKDGMLTLPIEQQIY